MAETFVLVHGAWHGAWCWGAVITQLQARGHRALAVDLPGSGQSEFDRAHVTLATYVDSVAAFIEERRLENVVLVGHSMGGLVISGVGGRIPRRLKRVVFATAMVMADGEEPLERNSDQIRPLVELARSRPDRSLPPEAMAEPFRARFIQDAPRAFQDFVLSALTPQPLAPMLEPVAMKEFQRAGLPTGYLICDHDFALGPNLFHERFLPKLDRPEVRTISSDHEFMFTHPVEGARAIEELGQA